MSLRQLSVAVLVAWCVPVLAAAQDKELVPDKLESEVKDKPVTGWVPKLSLGATFALAHNAHVAGAQDGTNFNLGPLLDFSIAFLHPEHEWKFSLSFRNVWTRTPVIDEFVKTIDMLKIESGYLYHNPNLRWIGPFALVGLDTSIFPGRDVRPTDTAYATTEIDGSATTETKSAIGLTNAFAPLVLKQSAGAFLRPLERKEVTIDFRVGFGAREAWFQNGRVLNDDAATKDVVELKRLEDFSQVGGELFAGIAGAFVFEKFGIDRPIEYSVSCEVLLPFYSTLIPSGKKAIELTTVDFQTKIGIKIFSWMGLDYALRVVRAPLITEDIQVQNTLLLNFSYVYAPPPPAPAPAK